MRGLCWSPHLYYPRWGHTPSAVGESLSRTQQKPLVTTSQGRTSRVGSSPQLAPLKTSLRSFLHFKFASVIRWQPLCVNSQPPLGGGELSTGGGSGGRGGPPPH